MRPGDVVVSTWNGKIALVIWPAGDTTLVETTGGEFVWWITRDCLPAGQVHQQQAVA